MADFNALEALINAHIKKNGVQAITGNILNGILRGMVAALGKGYTIAGSASPATDPGTMTGPLAYIAYTAGTYTHFGGLEVEQGEVAMLIYNEAEWHKEVLFSLAASATIDGNVGTPEVGVSFVDGQLTFDFRNMKGAPGNNGAAAGFGTVNATVDDQIGTPSVSVQSSGPDTAKNFTFAFHNLKGAQGDTGSSVDYPFTIVNNLTTNDATQALSAAMGVQLEAEVSQLEAKVTDSEDVLDFSVDEEVVTTTADQSYYINYNNGARASSSSNRSTDYVNVSGYRGKTLKYLQNVYTVASGQVGMAFYDSNYAFVSGVPCHFGGSAEGVEETTTIVPNNASYARFSIFAAFANQFYVEAVLPKSHRMDSLEQEVGIQGDTIDAIQVELDKIYPGQDSNYEPGRITTGGNVVVDSYSDGWYIPTDFIPCQQGDVLSWISGENDGAGRHELCLYDADKNFITGAYWSPSAQPKSVTITSAYSSARYVRMSFKLKKADNTENTTPLLINGVAAFTVKNYIPGLTPTDAKASEALEKVNQLLPTDTEHGIIGENYPSEVLVVENQLQAKLSNRFHFIHISDNHGASFGYAQQYLDLSPAKFLINTGDLVADKFADKDLASFQTITLATEPTKPVYLALGNHDYSHATSRQAVFDAFIAPTNTHNGTAFDKTYYALDFGTEKVKCIVLDMNDGWADENLPDYGPSGNLTWGKMSQTQINWLATQLQDAITNSLDVVIFIHTPPAQVSRFNRIKDFSDTINLDYARNLTFLPGLIDAFINGETASFTYDGNNYSFTFASGGHFVSWVCGHEHGDLCGWMDGHENQFIAVVCRPYRDSSVYGGSYDGDKLGVHWNYCTIDTGRKSFAVYRMGQQTTIFGTDRVSFRILYK